MRMTLRKYVKHAGIHPDGCRLCLEVQESLRAAAAEEDECALADKDDFAAASDEEEEIEPQEESAGTDKSGLQECGCVPAG